MTKTPKGRALGSALRQARQDRDLTVRAFAAQLGRDPGVLSRWETGERTPKPEHVAQILTSLGVNGEQYEEIIQLTYGANDPNWVATTLPAQRQQLAAFIEFEQNATKILEAAPLLIPGLLQTSDYTRALMTEARIPAGELATRVAVRIGRREVITRNRPARFTALVGEAALRQIIGSRELVAAQLRHLLETARRPNVDLRVFRFDSGWHPALEGPFHLIETDDATVVHLEMRNSALFLHRDSDVRAYRQAAERALDTAMNPVESVKLIRFIADSMEDGNER
ncbi:helix-turn-helix domain-containing protein [Saccharopolyspora phatthalungensis]|uniref:Transcriptional regulator with XRE-family HTH domain n=1 Tax=Saccharopolyspora phatthalungensis TaxID=664693 RepID=A0A840QCN4_9PSEU|nr:helix-turn-helix transcriptional regulator [Saccharopolyspora phatthalungensis]MBB5157727.1 transcriptional regulator with XRE-family HTH domain [Saccharopolyspora phatthalungensis]